MNNDNKTTEGRATIWDLLLLLWGGRWTIALVAASIAIVFGLSAFLRKEQYKAAVVIAPVSNTGGQLGGMDSLPSQLGGLASLAGLSIGGNSQKSESLAVLQSDALARQYIRDNNLLPVLFRKQWNSATGQWVSSSPDDIPTLWMGTQRFKKSVRKVALDSKTGIVTVTVIWHDPKVAARWANGLVNLANVHLRGEAVEEAERNIAYLNEQAAKTNIVEAREAIFSLLRNQINKAMLARGTEEFAFRVLDLAVPPEKPSAPNKLLWTAMGVITGLLLGTFIVLARAAWSSRSF